MILPNFLQTLPHFTDDASAWTWIAQQLSEPPWCSAIQGDATHPSPRAGLCLVLIWMQSKGMISLTRKVNMVNRLYKRFAPQKERGEKWDGPFYWRRGVRQPRVIAAQLMAILPVPRQGGGR